MGFAASSLAILPITTTSWVLKRSRNRIAPPVKSWRWCEWSAGGKTGFTGCWGLEVAGASRLRRPAPAYRQSALTFLMWYSTSLHSKYSRAVIKADWRLQCELWKWTKDWTTTVGHKLVFFPPMDLLLACIAMTIDNISSNTYREVKVAKVRRLSWGKEKAAQEEERTRRHSFIFSKLLAAPFSRSSFDKWKCRTGEQTYQHWFPMQGGRAAAWKQSEMHFLENQLWPRQLSPAASRPSWHKVCSSAETQLDQFYRRRQIEKCQNLRSLNCSFDLATSSTIVPCQDFLGFWCRPPRWWRRPPWWWWRPTTEWTHGPTDQLTRIGAKDAYASTKAIMCNLLIDHLVSLLVSHLPGEGGDRMEVWECNGPTGLLARQGLVLEMLMYLKMKINHPSLLEFHFK